MHFLQKVLLLQRLTPSLPRVLRLAPTSDLEWGVGVSDTRREAETQLTREGARTLLDTGSCIVSSCAFLDEGHGDKTVEDVAV